MIQVIDERYRSDRIGDLAAQQVRYAPIHVRLVQIDRAEKLLDQIDPTEHYSYRDICRSITSYKPEPCADLVISGSDLLHDLRCFIEDLSASVDLSVEDVGEPVLTVQEVSRLYSVSTKTVDRWRNRGLASRWFRWGKRRRLGFLKSTVDRFVRRHAAEVERSSRFRQLTDEERREIIRRARKMARYGACPTEISRRIAQKMGRSPETVRYTLRAYDEQHPESAVFPNSQTPLTEEQKQEIFQAYRRGVSVADLARKYQRTRSSIYRIISEVRAKRLLETPIEYIYSPEFDQPDAEKVILGPPPQVEKKQSTVKPPPGLPPYLASLYSIPLLTREEEVYYFRKMNYLKYKAAKLRERIDPAKPKASELAELEKLLDEATEIKNFLIRSNLRLVVSIAKRHIRANTNFFEMVSDGNMSLIRAIEKFDYTKGNKFSTYASWAIMKNYARSIPAEHSRLDRFRTGHDEIFQNSSDARTSQYEEERINEQQRQVIQEILDQLDPRERDIITYRFGLDYGEPQTLEQVGKRFGVTKERIRQIEARALRKLRKIAMEEKLDVPGV